MKEILHIAIVEDDNEIRQALALFINNTPGFVCNYTYRDAESAVKHLSEHYIHVVLMDIELPGISGIKAIALLKPLMQETDFIMLTIKQDDESIFNSLCAGASGYLLKDTPPTELLKSIVEVNNGGSPMSSNIARKVIASFQKTSPPSPLTKRETEILQMLCTGMNYRTIADAIFLSAHTVKSHIKNIYKKLHVNSRAGLVKKAIKDNLL